VQEPVGDASKIERRCLYPGCPTTLSDYNSDVLCWTHADERTRVHFDRASEASRNRSVPYRQR
jgi:hypothetical protein